MAQQPKRRKQTASRTKLTEKEIREHYESKRGDVSDWADKPVSIVRSQGAGRAVFSVRFSASELTAIKQWADAAGRTVSEFVRTAALHCGATGLTPTIRYENTPSVRIGAIDIRSIGTFQDSGFDQSLHALH